MTTYINACAFTVATAPGSAGAIVAGVVGPGPRRLPSAADNGKAFKLFVYEGSSFEIRSGCVYTHGTTTFTRGTLEDSSTGGAINFTGSAQVNVVGATAADLGPLSTVADAYAANLPYAKTESGTAVGLLYEDGHYGDVRYTYSAASPGQTIDFAHRAVFTYASAGNATGIGHYGAQLAWMRVTGSGNPQFVISHEAKLEQLGAGTTTIAKLYEGQLAVNAGSISLLLGGVFQVIGNDGTIGHFIGNNVDISSNNGNVNEVTGYLVSDMSARTGIGKKWGIRVMDPQAPSVFAGSVTDTSMSRLTPANGGSTTLTRFASWVLLYHSATIASHTFTLPSGADVPDGFTITLTSLNNISAVTWVAGDGENVDLIGGAISAGVTLRMRLDKTGNVWWLV